MQPFDSDWSRTCLDRVVPTQSGKTAAVALARQLDEKGLWHPLVVLLNRQGEALAGSNRLASRVSGNGRALTLTGKRQGLVVVTQREQPTNPGASHEVHHWFSVRWRGSKITTAEIGPWEGIRLGSCIRGTPIKHGSLWVGSYYPQSESGDFLGARLLVANSDGLDLPVVRLTEVEGISLSEPIPFGEEVYVLVTARYERVELWAIDRQLQVRKVLDVDRKRNKKESLGPTQMARCGDSLILVWGHHTDRVGAKKPRTWQGLLRTASYRPNEGTMSGIVEATPDTRVVAATLQTHSFDHSVVVTWESRPKRGGGGMRAIRLTATGELPCDPVAIPEKSTTLFLIDESGPFLRSSQMPSTSSWILPADLPPL